MDEGGTEAEAEDCVGTGVDDSEGAKDDEDEDGVRVEHEDHSCNWLVDIDIPDRSTSIFFVFPLLADSLLVGISGSPNVSPALASSASIFCV